MDFVNLTPHPIKVQGADGTRTIEPSGTVARVKPDEDLIGDIDGIPLKLRKGVTLPGLPSPKPDTYYIVSSMVLSETKNRPDVIAPDTGEDAIRDELGRIQAVKGFVTASTGGKSPSESSGAPKEAEDWVGAAIL